MKIAIIGSGSWGVALAIHLAKMGNQIKIWSFDKEEARIINEERKCKFLPKIEELPENIECKLSYEEVIPDSDMILQVTPSKFTRNIVRDYKKYVQNQPIIICSKGIENATSKTLDEVVAEEVEGARVAALSGPSHAEEVSLGIPTVLVAASNDDELNKIIQDTFMNENIRVYTSNDIKGVELGGALKNIIAFCVGVATGLGFGDNTNAALITRGLQEISKLGAKMGGKRDTFYGLSGFGDLIVTALSEHSRNRKAGFLIGQGKTLEETKQEVGMVIESIDNIEVAYKLAKEFELEVPIISTVYDVLFNNLDPKDAVNILMTREKKQEM